MAEDLAQQRVERPWLVNLQWALALVCGAIAVWALTPSGPTAPCRDRLFRADGALPRQMRGATGPCALRAPTGADESLRSLKNSPPGRNSFTSRSGAKRRPAFGHRETGRPNLTGF